MNYDALLWTCCIGFLVSVPTVLAMRARRPRLMPWWLVVALSAGLGWIASNTYSYVEWLQHEDIRAHAGSFALIDFLVVAPPEWVWHWGWSVGLVYLVICLGHYRLLLPSVSPRISRPLLGLAAAAVTLAIVFALPPWNEGDWPSPAFGFLMKVLIFLLCAGASLHILRWLRLEQPWQPFVVMFSIAFLPFAVGALGANPDVWQWVGVYGAWAAMFAAVFTEFWWIAIRKG